MDHQLKKLIALAEALDPICTQAMELPDGPAEITQTGDEIERYKLVIAIRAGILARELTRAGIAPSMDRGWGPLEQRLSKL